MRYVIPTTTAVPARLALYQSLADSGAGNSWARRIDTQRFAAMLDDESAAWLVLDAAQRIAFVADPDGPDVVHDVDTTVRQGGDCEDLAICTVAGAMACGLPARLVWLDPATPSSPQAHVAAQILVAGSWLWAEPSVRAALGEHPWSAAARLGLMRRIGQ